MSYRTFRWPLAIAALLTLSAVSAGQSKPDTEKWDGSASGTAKAGLTTTIKVELKGSHKDLTLATLVAKFGKVSKGDVLATLNSPHYARTMRRAEQAVKSAQDSVTSTEIALAHMEQNFALQRAKADRDLATAETALKNWNDWRKQDRIRSSELSLRSRANSIKDQEEELAQLERLYQGNDLAKESQDIVLNRSKRRLSDSKERYEMLKRNHKTFIASGIPNQEAALVHTVSSRKLEVERLTKLAPISNSKQKSALVSARNRLEDVTRTRDDLAADKDALTIKAPHDGVVIAPPSGPMGRSNEREVGDKVSNKSALLRVMDTRKLTLKVDAPIDVATKLKVGDGIMVGHLGMSTGGSGVGTPIASKITAVGVTQRKGKVTVEIEVDNSAGLHMPGLELKVVFGE